MPEQDPLKRSRLGLRGVLLVSGGVLVASSVFLLPNLGLLQGQSSATNLSAPSDTSGIAGTSDVSRTSELPERVGPTAADGSSSGNADASSSEAAPLLPVYWLGAVDGGSDRLFREFLTGPEDVSVDPIAASVSLMTAGDPLDPDYYSPWQPASSVSSSISTQNVITLDIASDAFGGSLPEGQARLAVQQLVYTATAAASNAGLIAGGESSSVVVLVDGAAGYRAFDAVDLDGEWTRDASVLSPVWIIDPQQDVEARGTFTIHGVAPTEERLVRWRIDRLDDGAPETGADSRSLFRDGSVEVEPGQAATGTYSFSETLPPGRYDITVSAVAGGATATDTKTVVVR